MTFRNKIAQYVVAAFAGGLVAYAIETGDRVTTLWPSFNAWYEIPMYAAYLAPTVLLGCAAGLAVAVVLLAVGSLRTSLESLAKRRGFPKAATLAVVTSAVVVGLALRGIVALQYSLIADPLLRLAQKVSARITPIPFVINHFGLMLAVGCLAAGFVILIVEVGLSTRQRGWPNIFRIAAALASIALLVLVYSVDSRLYFGRYELVMHLPLMAATLVLAFLTAGLLNACRRFDPERAFPARFVVATLVLALGASTFAAIHMGSNKNVKALLWRRSIIARRAFQGAAVLADRDRDGFASLLDGADSEEGNAAVNPLATEIPGNGVDENGIGGDGVAGPVGQPVTLPLEPASPGAATNFILVSIDTLRADRMSCYGYGRPTATQLDRVGRDGVVFDHAYSQGSNTGQSFASMQRSATRGAIFDDSRPSLFGRLADAGFRTTFINARRDDVWLETKRWTRYRKIILDGVATYDHVSGEPLWDGDAVTDRAIAYLGSLDPGTRHATWVHYLDPHEPRKKMAPFDFGNTDSDKYDSEVAFADREVARLIDWLRTSGRLQNTIVVLMADHGESFLDHGMDLHGNRPYNEQIHVPLMMWAPDVTPSRVSEAVGIVDVAPTVLGYLGLAPIPGAEGRDVLRAAATPRPMFAETPLNLNEVSFFAYAVTEGGWRYIYDVRGNTEELYELASDPAELHNLADARPERLAELRATMAKWLDSTRSVRTMRGA